MRSFYAFSLVSGILLSTSAHAYSLGETIKAAKEYNYDIKAQKQRVKLAEVSQTEAYTRFLPTVQSQIQVSKTRNIQDAYRSSTIYNIPHQTTSSIQINQSLFNGGVDAYGIQIAKSGLNQSNEEYKSVLNKTLFEVISAYEDVSTRREMLKLNEVNVKVYSEFLALSKTKFELGEITITDVIQTESRLSEAIAEKEIASTNLLAAEANFKDIVGHEPPKDLKSVILNDSLLPKTLEAFLSAVKNKNPDLLSASSRRDIASKKVNIAYSNFLPTADASISFNNTANTSKSVNNSGTTYAVTVKMPFFQGGREYTAVKKSREAREESKYVLSRIESSLQSKAITAWNTYALSKYVLESRKRSIEAAEKSLAGVREEAKMGTRTTLDVLTEQTNLFSSQVNYRRAVQEQVSAFYTIQAILGDLDKIEYT